MTQPARPTSAAQPMTEATRSDVSRVAGDDDEVLCHTDRTRIVRRRLPGRAEVVICKEPLGPGAGARLRHERQMLQRLAGVDGISRLASHLTDGASPPQLLVLQDVGGTALTARLRAGPLPLAQIFDIAVQLARAVAAIHRLGVVHRDINPANILLSGPPARVTLIDFNLASSFADERPAFTHQSEIVGTLAYLAPEQTGRTGRVVDQRADLYALGATLYELATGRPPFEGTDPLQLIRDHLARVPTWPSLLDARVPAGLSDIVMHLLDKEPDRRYQSADGLLHDLLRLQALPTPQQHSGFPLGERDFAARLAAPSRLVGRDAEITLLREAFGDALHTPRRGLLLAGAPGVGKTALANELRPLVTAAGGWFVSGKFDQFGRDAMTGAVTQALRALGRLLLAEPKDELTAQRERLLAALGCNAGVMTTALPEFALLLGPQPEVATVDPVEAEVRLLQTTLDLLHSIVSPARPLVMVLDDLQWAGAVGLRLIERVLSDPSLRGMLVLGTYRDAEIDPSHAMSAMLPRWDRLSPPPRRLRLDNLPAAGLGELIGEMLRLPQAQAAGLADAVSALTAGNPNDSVELVNALRRDGVLATAEGGWTWDPAAIRRFVGQGSVADLLATRIERLPAEARGLLETMACLGAAVELGCLQAAAALTPDVLETQLRPALEDGLLLLDRSDAVVRFRHDRVQQAVHGKLGAVQRGELQRQLGQRLAQHPELQARAAEQYLSCIESLQGPAERRRVALLLRTHAARLGRTATYSGAERYLTAARTLLLGLPTQADAALLGAIEVERHAALYNLGRLDEADRVFLVVQGADADPLSMLDPTCAQISSLYNRGLLEEAVALGFGLLRRLGLDAPDPQIGAPQDSERRLDSWYRSLTDNAQRDDRHRPLKADARVLAVAKLFNRLLPPTHACSSQGMTWLMLESQRLWVEHGPCAELVGPVSHAAFVVIETRSDFRAGYDAVRHVLDASEARGYEPQTSQARFLLGFTASHWFEPLEHGVAELQRAREGLLRGGDLQSACFTHMPSLLALLDCAPTLDVYAAEIDSALGLAARTGNDYASRPFLVHRQLLRALRGETDAAASPRAAQTEKAPPGRAAARQNALGATVFHALRALAAALLGDTATQAQHAEAALRPMPHVQCFYAAAQAQLLLALARAEQARHAAPAEQARLLVEFDAYRDWLARRAADAPANFAHLLPLLDAERAQAVGDFRGAIAAFDEALRKAASCRRAWHRALITERAGLFHLSHGLLRSGHDLLAEARGLYQAWGAGGKVQQLERNHAFLAAHEGAAHALSDSRASVGSSNIVSSDAIDLIGVLRASQALSSETSLERLKLRVCELLGAMTGATAVSIATRDEELQEWFLLAPASAGEAAASIPVAEAGARGLLPLSAFHYAERTREPLRVDDATRDDRFARDPYFAGQKQCSLLLVPIDSQGAPRAMLLLENRLSGRAFAADRLDAVMLIAGQLAVSLDNAMLYASLERKVAERTDALEQANQRLALLSVTDPLTGLANRRRFAEVMQAEWLRAVRPGLSIGLAMIDIDQFKLYNDHYGHLAGDACLQRVASTLKTSLRLASDMVARYGGEEFVLVLPGTDRAGTWAAADRLRSAVAALRLPHAKSIHGIVTISVGVTAVVPGTGGHPEQHLQIADAALYAAKGGGRNRVAAQ